MEPHTQVGIGVLVVKDGKILLGQRKGSHGAGEFGGTGGHLEYMESIFECAKRETLEETGITIKNIRLLCVSNIKDYAPKHYVDIGLVADWESGEPTIMEPNKVESWGWYDPKNLPTPLFAAEPNYIEAYLGGNNFFDK
jgi:8-oxo-dGTP diphosphatase